MTLSTPLWRWLQSLTGPRRRPALVAALVIGGVLVSGVSAFTVARLEASRQDELVDGELRIVESRIERAATNAVDALESLRPLWRLTSDVTDADFKAYLAAGLTDRVDGAVTYAGLSDVAFIRAVDADETGAFVRARRAERPRRYVPDIDGTSPHYIVDFHSSDALLGVDLYPLPQRREALDAARDRGTAAASEWYVTVSDVDLPPDRQRQLTLIAVPVYEGGVTPDTVADRRRQLIGWVAAPLFATPVAEQSADDLLVSLALFEGADTDGTPVATVGEVEPALTGTTTVDVLQRQWTVQLDIPAAAVGGPALGWPAVFAGGLLFTTVLTVLLWLLLHLGHRSERRAATATEQLREREDYLRVIAEHVTVGLADLDADGRIAWANHRLAGLLGVDEAQVADSTWPDLVHPDDRPAVIAALGGAVHGGQPFDVRHRLAFDDDERWIEVAGAPIVDAHGVVRRVVVVCSDVSVMVEFEAQLRAARDKAVEASRLKSEFLANMSHEIRTPLNGVIGMADVLYRSNLSGAQRSKVATLRTAAAQLGDLLNDILDLSKIEAGRLALDTATFDLTETISGIVQLHASQAFDAGLTLRIDIDETLPALVNGPQLRLRQVLNNLLGNAIKFTEQGEVRLSVQRRDSGDDTVRIGFEVADTGIGIPVAVLDAIFDPFTQADSSDTRAYGGTGLGLAISRQLVEMMGGALTVTSAVGEGSRFSFTIELETVADARTQDDVAAATLTPTTASTADDAEVPAEPHRDEGADGHPTRAPWAVDDLDAGDLDAGDDTPATSAAGSDPRPHAVADDGRAKLLIVEDNPINQEVARELLASLGYDTDVANDGAEGVDAVLAHRYDAVLMDCQMPGMDGYEATARIRRHEAGMGQHTPIIAMTASAMVGDRQRCLAAGMDDYIAKPVSVAALSETVERWVAATTDPGTATHSEQPEEAGEPPVIDWQILHQLSVVPGLLERSRTKFLENAQSELAELRQLAADGDHAELGSVAHKLKGASLTIGAARLGARLQRIEAAADADPTAIDDLLTGLDECFEDVREALLATETV